MSDSPIAGGRNALRVPRRRTLAATALVAGLVLPLLNLAIKARNTKIKLIWVVVGARPASGRP